MNGTNHLLNGQYSIKEITDLNSFEKLRSEWDNLVHKHGAYAPFLCFDWFKIWLDHFLKNNKLLILLLYENDKLVAIAPFLISLEQFKSIMVKKIELIGNIYSPIRDFIFDKIDSEKKRICLSSVFCYLFNNLVDWDIIDLFPIPEQDEILNLLDDIIRQRGYQTSQDIYCEKWYTNGIDYSADEYLNKRSRRLRKDLRRTKRRLEDLGSLEFKIIKGNDEIERYINYYYQIYAKSWKKRERIGPTFHRDLARIAAEKGWLRLGMLFLGNTPLAAEFCIVFHSVGFFLKSTYDQEYKKYGPGNIVQSETIKYIIDHDKIKEIDFGFGGEDYKSKWVARKRDLNRIVVFNNNLKGNSLAFLNNRILPMLNKHKSLNKIKKLIANRL